ncbi:MAG TPA: ABC transporter ATP-binding protein [Firmicutes bacterium]|nr:ABC transporter ATP-binding protein [Bacillota bacterium]
MYVGLRGIMEALERGRKMNVLTVEELTHQYRAGVGIFEVSFCLPAGESLGVAGLEGAGKTTLLKALMGLVSFSGKLFFMGQEITWTNNVPVLQNCGYVPASYDFYEGFRGKDVLEFAAIGRTVDPERKGYLLSCFNIDDQILKGKASDLSPDIRQKLVIIAAMQHQPVLLVLDEAAAVLDLSGRKVLNALLREHCRAGGAVIFSSRELAELEKFCSRVLLMQKGVIIADERVEELGDSLHFQLAEDIDSFLRKIFTKGRVKQIECRRSSLEQYLNKYYRGDEKNA